MGYAVLRLQKVKSFQQVESRIKHNHRVYNTAFKSDVKNPRIVIRENHHINQSYEEFVKERIDKKVRKNAVVAVEIVTSFSAGSQPEDLKKWVGENIKWVGDNFGGVGNIFDVALHVDETTPHLHFIVAPIENRSLNCFHYINGRGDLTKMQTSYAESMSQFGLKRGLEREKTRAFHTDFKTFRATEIDKIRQIEEVERKKVMKKIYDEVGISPQFREDYYER